MKNNKERYNQLFEIKNSWAFFIALLKYYKVDNILRKYFKEVKKDPYKYNFGRRALQYLTTHKEKDLFEMIEYCKGFNIIHYIVWIKQLFGPSSLYTLIDAIDKYQQFHQK